METYLLARKEGGAQIVFWWIISTFVLLVNYQTRSAR